MNKEREKKKKNDGKKTQGELKEKEGRYIEEENSLQKKKH